MIIGFVEELLFFLLLTLSFGVIYLLRAAITQKSREVYLYWTLDCNFFPVSHVVFTKFCNFLVFFLPCAVILFGSP